MPAVSAAGTVMVRVSVNGPAVQVAEVVQWSSTDQVCPVALTMCMNCR